MKNLWGGLESEAEREEEEDEDEIEEKRLRTKKGATTTKKRLLLGGAFEHDGMGFAAAMIDGLWLRLEGTVVKYLWLYITRKEIGISLVKLDVFFHRMYTYNGMANPISEIGGGGRD
ncbi:hypothetical protein ACJX0J_041381 [Zea mays]